MLEAVANWVNGILNPSGPHVGPEFARAQTPVFLKLLGRVLEGESLPQPFEAPSVTRASTSGGSSPPSTPTKYRAPDGPAGRNWPDVGDSATGQTQRSSAVLGRAMEGARPLQMRSSTAPFQMAKQVAIAASAGSGLDVPETPKAGSGKGGVVLSKAKNRGSTRGVAIEAVTTEAALSANALNMSRVEAAMGPAQGKGTLPTPVEEVTHVTLGGKDIAQSPVAPDRGEPVSDGASGQRGGPAVVDAAHGVIGRSEASPQEGGKAVHSTRVPAEDEGRPASSASSQRIRAASLHAGALSGAAGTSLRAVETFGEVENVDSSTAPPDRNPQQEGNNTAQWMNGLRGVLGGQAEAVATDVMSARYVFSPGHEAKAATLGVEGARLDAPYAGSQRNSQSSDLISGERMAGQGAVQEVVAKAKGLPGDSTARLRTEPASEPVERVAERLAQAAVEVGVERVIVRKVAPGKSPSSSAAFDAMGRAETQMRTSSKNVSREGSGPRPDADPLFRRPASDERPPSSSARSVDFLTSPGSRHEAGIWGTGPGVGARLEDPKDWGLSGRHLLGGDPQSEPPRATGTPPSLSERSSAANVEAQGRTSAGAGTTGGSSEVGWPQTSPSESSHHRETNRIVSEADRAAETTRLAMHVQVGRGREVQAAQPGHTKTAAASHAPDWSVLETQVRSALQRLVANDGRLEVLVHLRPPELGRLRLRVSTDQKEILVRLEADHRAAHEILQARLPEIEKMLANHSHLPTRVEILNPHSGKGFVEDEASGRWWNGEQQGGEGHRRPAAEAEVEEAGTAEHAHVPPGWWA